MHVLREFHETLAPMLNWFSTHPDCCSIFLVPLGSSDARTSARQSEPALKRQKALRNKFRCSKVTNRAYTHSCVTVQLSVYLHRAYVCMCVRARACRCVYNYVIICCVLGTRLI